MLLMLLLLMLLLVYKKFIEKASYNFCIAAISVDWTWSSSSSMLVCKSSKETLSSSTTQLICNFLIPKPIGMNWWAPQVKPSMVIALTVATISSKSVSSSHGLTSKVTIDLAAGLAGLAAFLALYAAILSAFNFSAAASASSSSEPNRSTSSSSSSSAAAAEPEAAGKDSNSSALEAMWLNHLENSG